MSALKLLAIETSSSTGSIALGVGDDVCEQQIATPREQTPRILAIIDELLSDAGLRLADLDALVFGRGPGSFTGLRVAAAVVQGLSFSAGPPIVSVSSLAALAQRAVAARGEARAAGEGPAQVLCVIDARMGEVYSAEFAAGDGRVAAVGKERISRPDSVAAPAGPFIAVGDALSAYPAELARVIGQAAGIDAALVPGARELLVLAEAEARAKRFVSVQAALPVYLRESDAWQKA